MGEESSEMYSPDEQGEYGTATAASSFTIHGLPDALMALDPEVIEVTEVPLPKVEYALPPWLISWSGHDHPHFCGTWGWSCTF